ncbi:hypothetical protein ACGFWD_41940 [Streptomyces sp. NPDC048448]|uniref:hypothetical protein n=1 Tax=Streptomyces sp. NPDC048448 TaxID=3365554 RepID=UPI003711273F
MTTPDCYACSKEAEFDDLSPRECVVYDQHWRVAHAFNTAVPGWLVLLPRTTAGDLVTVCGWRR